MQYHGNFTLNQNTYNFAKYLKNCENKKICTPHYSKLETAGNNPNQTKRMRYAEYVSNTRGVKIVNQEKITIYINSVYVPDYTSHSITFAFDGSYNTARICQENITRGIVQGNVRTFTDINLQSNKIYNYKIIPYDINGVFVDQPEFQVITLGEITFFKYGKITTNSIELLFDGSYQNVSLYTISGELIKEGLKNSYIDISLNPGVPYSYSLVTLNDVNRISPNYLTTPIYTLPNLLKNYYGNIGYNSMQLFFEGSYNTVSIICNESIIYNNIVGSSYTIYDLIPNTSYSFVVIPFIDEISGNSLFYNSKYTLPEIIDISFIYLTSYSITMQINGFYNYYNIIRNDGFVINNIYSSEYTDISLNANTEYYYEIIPFNFENKSGRTFVSSSIYTYAILLSYNISDITTNSVKLEFNGIFSSLYLLRNDNEIFTGISNQIFYDDSLISNTEYDYKIIAYNGNNIPTETVIQTDSFSTLPVLYDVSFTNITTNSMKLNISGAFNSVVIKKNNGKFLILYNPVSIIGDNYIEYTDDYNMTNNTDYSYIITPYNKNNNSGKIIFTPFVFTLPILVNFSYADISTNSVSFNIDGCYNIFNITRYDNNYNVYNYSTISLYYTDYTVLPNKEYYYVATSVNGDGLFGNSIELPFICTLPQITNLYYTDISFNKITINIVGNYNRVLIQRNDGYDTYQDYKTKYIDNTVYPNTSYQYYLTPFNSFNQSTYIIPMGIVCTSALIMDASFSDISTNSFTINIDGIYNYYSIKRNDNIIDVSYLNGITFTDYENLAIDKLYYYTITPFNNTDISGIPFITGNTYIRPVLYDINIDSLSILPDFLISKNFIKFPIINGSYYYYNLYRNSNLIVSNILFNNNYTDNNNGLSLIPNTIYNYKLIPYNRLRLPGGYYDISICTLSLLNNITSEQFTCYTNYYEFPIFSGNYSYLNIYRNGIIIESNFTDNTYIDNIDFYPNTLTNYVISSYNHVGNIGDSYSVYVWTLPRIDYVVPNFIAKTYIKFTLYGYFSNISIERYSSSLPPPYSNSIVYTPLNNGDLTNSIVNGQQITFIDYGYTDDTVNGLTHSTYYTYNITPYNGDNFSGDNFTFTYKTLS